MHTYRILRPDDARELAMLHARAFDTPWSAAAIRSTLGTSGSFGLALSLRMIGRATCVRYAFVFQII